MLKKVICVIMALTVVFALVACNDNSDLLKRIKELESAVQQQQDTIDEWHERNSRQQDTISDLQKANERQQDKIAKLEDKNEEQQSTISELEEKVRYLEEMDSFLDGKLYSLEDAYNYGYITKDDIMNMIYFGNRYFVSAAGIEDFIPQMKAPIKLSKSVLNVITTTLGNEYKVWENLGIYGDCISVLIYQPTMGEAERPWRIIYVGGIKIAFKEDFSICIWKRK